jgi:hypothetical protein
MNRTAAHLQRFPGHLPGTTRNAFVQHFANWRIFAIYPNAN